MPTIFQPPRAFIPNASGVKYAGAKAYFYITGTTTPKDTYTDFALTTPSANPVVADGNGDWATIYLENDARYRVTLKTSADVLIYTQDDVGGPVLTQSEMGAIFYPQTAAESAAGVTPSDYAKEPYTPERYGAVGDGSTDDSAAIRSGLSCVANYGVFKFTAGKKYRWECSQVDPYTGTGSQNGYVFNAKTGIVIDARGATFVITSSNSSTFGLINFYGCTSCEVWGGHVEGSYTIDSSWTGGYVAFQGACRNCKLVDGSIEGGYALATIIDKTSAVSGSSANEPVDCYVSGYANATRRSVMMLGAGAGHRVDVRCGDVSRFYVESCRGMTGRLTIRNTSSSYTNEKILFTGSNGGVTQNINLQLDCDFAAANFVRFQCQDTSSISFKNIKLSGQVRGTPSSSAVALGAGSGSAGVSYDNIDLSDLYVEVAGGSTRAVYLIPSHAITMSNIRLPRIVRSAGTGNVVEIDNSATATISGVSVPDDFRITQSDSGAIQALKSTGGTVTNFRVGYGDIVASSSSAAVFTVSNADGFICGRVKCYNSKYVDFAGSKNLTPGIVLDQGGNGFEYSGALADATNYSGFEAMLVTSGSTTINNLKYIVPGQKITFIFNGGTNTFANGTNMKLAGAVNFTATSLDTLTLVCIDPPGGGPLSTSTMYEVCRSVN